MLYRFNDYTFDTATFELRCRGTAVGIEPQVLRLLQFLIENRHRVVSRNDIHRQLWGARFVTNNAIAVRIRSLRRALGDNGTSQAVIKTVHGAGYRFVASVEPVSEASMSLLNPGKETVPPGFESAPGSIAERMWRGQPSVAVLRFESIGNDDAEDVFARGLAHDLITRIARSRLMLIIARGTAFQFSAGAHDVTEIGRQLGVRFIVQGAVQIAGQRLKVSVALANTLTGHEVYSDQYLRKLDDFMAVQEDITNMIVSSIEAHVQREEMQRSFLMPSSSLDAWSTYHKGLHHLFRFKLRDCDRAESLFRRSIELEPTVPRAYAGLSFVHFERVFMRFDDNRSTGIENAFDYAEQSLAIDPSDPMGHWVLGRAQLLRGDLDDSKGSLERAIDLNPSYANARYTLGWVAMHLGEYELCRDSIKASIRLSPLDPFMYAMQGVLALNLALTGQSASAIALAEESIQHPNKHFQVDAFAAVTYSICGQPEQGRQLLKGVHRVAPDYDLDRFLSVFPFRRLSDRQRIGRAFHDMQASNRPY